MFPDLNKNDNEQREKITKLENRLIEFFSEEFKKIQET